MQCCGLVWHCCLRMHMLACVSCSGHPGGHRRSSESCFMQDMRSTVCSLTACLASGCISLHGRQSLLLWT